MSQVHLLSYMAAVSVFIIMPGLDFAIVLRNAITGGRAAARAAGAGIAAGLLCWTLAVAVGLGAVLAASATAYMVIKIAGIAYLAYLGGRSLWSAIRPTRPEQTATPTLVARQSPTSDVATSHSLVHKAFREGLLTNLFNPKVALTFLALMPQFLPTQPSMTGLGLLGVVTAGLALAWFQVVAYVVGSLQHVFSRSRVRRTMDAVTGTILLGFGIRLATD